MQPLLNASKWWQTILAGSLKSECSITDMAHYCHKFIMADHAIISMT